MDWAAYMAICREAKAAYKQAGPYPTRESEATARKQFERTCDTAFSTWRKSRKETK